MDKSRIKKNQTYGHCYGDTTGTPVGRIVWPALVTPRPGMKDIKTGKEGDPKYEASFLLPKKSKYTKAFIETLREHVEAMLKQFNRGRESKVSFRNVLLDGDNAEKFNPEKGKYWAGNWVLRARNTEMPVVCGTERDGDGWAEIPAKTVQGGMLCKAVVAPMITSGGQLTFKLYYVQLIEDDGQRFGGGFDKKMYAGLLSNKEFADDTSVDEDELAERKMSDVLGPAKKGKKKTAAPAAKKSGKPAKKSKPADEEEESDEDEEDEPAPKAKKGKAAAPKSKKKAPKKEEPEDEDEEEESDEDEEEEPAPKKRKIRKPAKEEESDDEEEESDTDEEEESEEDDEGSEDDESDEYTEESEDTEESDDDEESEEEESDDSDDEGSEEDEDETPSRRRKALIDRM